MKQIDAVVNVYIESINPFKLFSLHQRVDQMHSSMVVRSSMCYVSLYKNQESFGVTQFAMVPAASPDPPMRTT